MIKFLLWLLLLVLCWPLALLALVLWPVVWLISIPFRLLGIAVGGVFELLRAIVFLPARVLGLLQKLVTVPICMPAAACVPVALAETKAGFASMEIDGDSAQMQLTPPTALSATPEVFQCPQMLPCLMTLLDNR